MSETLQTALITSVSVIIGGAIATMPSLLQTWLENRRARKEQIRSKLEELVAAYDQIGDWWWELYKADTIDKVLQIQSSSGARKAQQLAIVNFPELIPAVRAHANALVAMHHFVIDAYQAGSVASAGAQIVPLMNSPKWKSLDKTQNETLAAVMEAIRRVAIKLS